MQTQNGEDPAGQAVQLVEAAEQNLATHRGPKAGGVVELRLEPVEDRSHIEGRARGHAGQFADQAAQGRGMVVVYFGV